MSDYGVKPVYEKIEFCRNAKALWGKIQSGRWDWVGVHPDGKFVVGSPRQSKGVTMRLATTSTTSGATSGEHGVYVRTPLVQVQERFWVMSCSAAYE